jgi:hypothetical protein
LWRTLQERRQVLVEIRRHVSRLIESSLNEKLHHLNHRSIDTINRSRQ